MIDWEKEFKEQFANRFLDERYMDEVGLGERIMTFIKEVLHEKDVAWLKETACVQALILVTSPGPARFLVPALGRLVAPDLGKVFIPLLLVAPPPRRVIPLYDLSAVV